ncbi:MerR family transcriptional regulator [Allorhizocola rhizosphaerae]|uniref:MerR family transcriptional regulator n=1 Tax=Allorhizocola rhizosphaerae TaxID=1872709 RepID=UPI000E3BEA15|nr:MerR family transcriptional regulator [Allorhizocola rhizosphaerae]
MRISELADLVGVTTRTVRHYHHLGLLPEPPRQPNGYREYRLRDAVALARIRRLTELGLSLDEIRDVLADDQGRELRDVLLELDGDLARQQEAIAMRRARLAALLSEAEPHPDSMVSTELAAVLRDLPAGGSPLARLDRQLLTLLDSRMDPAERPQVMAMLGSMATPEALARGQRLYARLDELAGAGTHDPRIAPLAHDIAAHIPPQIAAGVAEALADADGGTGQWMALLAHEVSPAQAEALRLAITKLREGR